MEAIMPIILIVFLVACLVCAFRESRVIGTYKVLHVFGRFKAYMALACTFGGLAAIVSGFVDLANGGIMYAGLGLVCLAIGVLLYWSSYRKCPDFLKKKCILDMIVVGLGLSFKIALFFIAAVWSMYTPDTATTTDGQEVYIFKDGTAYDPVSGKTGTYDAGSGTVSFPA